MVAKADNQDNLRVWIEEKRGDWSIRELARRAELSHVTVAQFLNRERNAGLTFCLGIAKAFRTSPMIIFALAGIIPPMDDDDVTFREILYHMRKLRRHDRYRLLRIAREWANEPVEEEEEEEPE